MADPHGAPPSCSSVRPSPSACGRDHHRIALIGKDIAGDPKTVSRSRVDIRDIPTDLCSDAVHVKSAVFITP